MTPNLIRAPWRAIERRIRQRFPRRPLSARVLFRELRSRGIDVVRMQTPSGTFWGSTHDTAIALSIAERGHFDLDYFERMTRAAGDALDCRPVFVDIGANIGTHTVYALRSGLFRSAICIEPDAANFRLLEMNIAENGLVDQCTLINAALGATEGTAVIARSSVNHGDHRVTEGHTAPSGACVPMHTLDGLLARLGVSPGACFLHVDVQSYEPHVFAGATTAIAQCVGLCSEYCPADISSGPAAFWAPLSIDFSGFYDIRDDAWHLIGRGETPSIPIDSGTTDLLFINRKSASLAAE